MKFTQIPADTFEALQLNAGVIASDFTPSTGALTASNILGATSGGSTFTASPSFSDWGDDIDNCPKNVKELKKLDEWDVKLTGTFVSIKPALAAKLVGAGAVDSTDTSKVVPRNDVDEDDFDTLWWIGDYSDKNGATNGGFVAIKLINALSTGGFQLRSGDRTKGNFPFEFTGHYSMSAQDTVPFEIYVKAGTAEPTGATGVTGA